MSGRALLALVGAAAFAFLVWTLLSDEGVPSPDVVDSTSRTDASGPLIRGAGTKHRDPGDRPLVDPISGTDLAPDGVPDADAQPEPEERGEPPQEQTSAAKQGVAATPPLVLLPTVLVPPRTNFELPPEVQDAVKRAVTWLKRKQQRDGSWGVIRGADAYGAKGRLHLPKPGGGPTALAVYVLLASGVPERDPAIRKGFQFLKLRFKKPDNALHASALLLAITTTAKRYKTSKDKPGEPPRVKLKGKYRGWATKLVDHLVERRKAQGWRYNVPEFAPPGGAQDLFSTHLAALALLYADRAGIKVKRKIWEDVLAFARAQQQRDVDEITVLMDDPPDAWRTMRPRGFAYIHSDVPTNESLPTGSMTAAGISTVAMARLVLSDWGSAEKHWLRREDAPAVAASMNDGMAWLGVNGSPSLFDNPKGDPERVSPLCWLWLHQCAMDAVGYEKRWYPMLIEGVLQRQHTGGYWHTGSTWEPQDVLDTCFAVLLLTRATRPWVQAR